MSSDELNNLKEEQTKLKNILDSTAGDDKKKWAKDELEKVESNIKKLTPAKPTPKPDSRGSGNRR